MGGVLLVRGECADENKHSNTDVNLPPVRSLFALLCACVCAYVCVCLCVCVCVFECERQNECDRR